MANGGRPRPPLQSSATGTTCGQHRHAAQTRVWDEELRTDRIVRRGLPGGRIDHIGTDGAWQCHAAGGRHIGPDWVQHNPYRGNATAAKIGESAYGQNCARCHGLDAESGGIAPDLRYLEVGDSGDEWFIQRYQHGSSHDGKVYMPPFGDVLGQKAGWAIRAWLETKHQE